MNKQYYDPTFVRNLFNHMSGSYEKMNYITSFGFSIRWRKQFVRNLPVNEKSIEVIDIMTGMGESWDAIRHRFPACNITAVDFSPAMLQAAYERKSKSDCNTRVIEADVLNNTLPSNYFDVVTCSYGLKTFDSDQWHVIARETKRILKKDGYFTFIEVSSPPNLILHALYSFYLGKVIPTIGKLFLADPRDYKLLWRYTSAFENVKKVQQVFENEGLLSRFKSYFFGCATGFYGVK